MANRIILGAALTLALLFSPGLAQTAPTKSVKKKSSPSKTEKAQTKKSSGKKKKTASQSGGSDSKSRNGGERVQGEMAGIGGETGAAKTPAPSVSASGVPETPPLMKVIPQRDGRFLLEPLAPKKSKAPLSRNSSPQPTVQEAASSERNYNRFEPWNFSDLILTQAGHYRDAPYCRGSSLATGSSTDCSGFVQFIYKGFKIDLPRSSAEQAQVGKVVTQNMDFSKLLPGDLLFFRRGGRYIGHAGIYLGEGKMIHASNRRYGVTITDLRQPYYEGTFVVAKRVFEVKYQQ
jgi:cell wall-associated NlpC family hydrolase